MSVPDGQQGPPGDSLDGPRVNRRRAVLGIAAFIVVIVAAGLAVYHERHTFVDALHEVGAPAFVASFAAGLFGVGQTYPTWRAVLRGLDVDIPWLIGARVFFMSQLGKYLPGSVWPVLIQMEAGRARGALRRTMLAANVLTIVVSCTLGLIVAVILLPTANSKALSYYWWLFLALPFLLALLHPRAVPWALNRVFEMVGRPGLNEPLHVHDGVRAAGWSLASFVALGAHVAMLTMAIDGYRFSTFLLCTGGMALAITAGILFVPAPAGAGIRDAVLIIVLSVVLARGEALAVAIASRALLVLADVCLAALAVLAGGRVGRSTDTGRPD